MKRMILSDSLVLGGVAALALFAALPVAAQPTHATAAAPASPAPAAEPEKAGAPYLIKVSEGECPVIPKGSSLSQKTLRLFETLTNACLMKASGVITQLQFEEIRDQIMGNLSMQLMTDANASAVPSSDQPLAANP